jgi:hypothetical protein
MILNFSAFWDNRRGNPFLNESIPAVNLGNTSLADFIRTEILNYHPAVVYADSDIRSVKSTSGRNHTRILPLPVSYFLQSIQDESPATLSVVIERSIIQPAAVTPPAATAMSRLMAASKPTQEQYKAKWSVSDVINFQSEYEAAVNKEGYLESLPIDKKPTITEQVEALVADFLNDNDLGFRGGSGGEEPRALKALKLLVDIVVFMHDRRATLGRSRVTMYRSSMLLRCVNDCVSARVRGMKRSPLTKDKVVDQLSKIDKCMGTFPSSYHRKVKDGSKYGEPIFAELLICKNILGDHHQEMLQQDARNKDSMRHAESAVPLSFNTKHYVVPPSM